MQWDEFYSAYTQWAPSTVATRISSLEDIGSGEEVVDAACFMDDEQLAARLIRKAMRLGVRFTQEDYDNLWCMIPQELYKQLGYYTGYDLPPEPEVPDKPKKKSKAVRNALLIGGTVGLITGIAKLFDEEKP